MQDQGYNGWTNYETWGVALVLDNEESTYLETQEMAQRCLADAPDDDLVADGIWTVDQAAKYRLADQLKDFTEMLCGLGDNDLGIAEPSMMAQQLLSGALSDVDWDEIAAAKITQQEPRTPPKPSSWISGIGVDAYLRGSKG